MTDRDFEDRTDLAADDGEHLVLAEFAERAYLDYAVSVVKGRALPDVRDGLKPVQRRILYAMQAMGLAANAKPVKSARVVGDVLGRFHPHGDQSAYDALVRLAQGFSQRYPLIDGHGNFGSRDGDGAAAMRYTEARLTPFARLLLDEIDQGTVDFVPNYDGSTEEPSILPARLPIALLNGASGIAVGLATEIPPHNLREVGRALVDLLRQPTLSLDEVLQRIPGPDFPGGGQLISSPAEIREAYSSGRGSLKLRARASFEELARGQWQWVVHELPHGVSSAHVLQEIEELTNPKIRTGKKALTPEQVQQRQTMLGLIDSVRDESSREAPVRLVFEPKSSRIDRDELVRTLLAQTSLECSYSLNLVVVDPDGQPGQRDLLTVLNDWLGFRTRTLRRRSEHRLAKVLDRIHVLEGRQLVLLNIDEVIAVIRESDDPKQALQARFRLSERQADDILEIRLRQLARLEAIKIEQELSALRAEQAELQERLENPNALRRLLIKELEADIRQFGDDRRTLIEPAERAVMEVKVVDEPITVIVSKQGWVRTRQGHDFALESLSFKVGDGLAVALPCRSVDNLVGVGAQGRVFSVPVSALPGGRGDGQPLASLWEFEAGQRPEIFLAGGRDCTVLITTQRGVGFWTRLGEMGSKQKAGKQFIQLDEGDALLQVSMLTATASEVICLSEMGRLLVFAWSELKHLGAGGRGTVLQQLEPQESSLSVLAIDATQVERRLYLTGKGRGGKVMRLPLDEKTLTLCRSKRGRKGKDLALKWQATGIIAETLTP